MVILSSGGIFYHYSYLRYKKLWKPFQNEFSALLPPGKLFSESSRILFLSPSGGYYFTPKKFSEAPVDVCDIDPLASGILKKRLKIKTQTVSRDLLQFLKSNTKEYDFIYVGNILGQKIDKKDEIAYHLYDLLKNKSFLMSYDRYSFDYTGEEPVESFKEQLLFSPQELPSDLFKNVVDHDTHHLFPNFKESLHLENYNQNSGQVGMRLSKKALFWQISPKRYHLVEVIRQTL